MFSRLFGRRSTEEEGADARPLFGRRQEEHSFEAVAMPQADALYGAALRMTRNETLAEDLVQETLMRAYRFWHKFQRGTNVKAWLFRIQITCSSIGTGRSRKNELSLTDARWMTCLTGMLRRSRLTPPPETRKEFLTHLVGDQVMSAWMTPVRIPYDYPSRRYARPVL